MCITYHSLYCIYVQRSNQKKHQISLPLHQASLPFLCSETFQQVVTHIWIGLIFNLQETNAPESTECGILHWSYFFHMPSPFQHHCFLKWACGMKGRQRDRLLVFFFLMFSSVSAMQSRFTDPNQSSGLSAYDTSTQIETVCVGGTLGEHCNWTDLISVTVTFFYIICYLLSIPYNKLDFKEGLKSLCCILSWGAQTPDSS